MHQAVLRTCQLKLQQGRGNRSTRPPQWQQDSCSPWSTYPSYVTTASTHCMHEPGCTQSGVMMLETRYLRIISQEGHICDGVYSEGGLNAAGRQACRLCEDGHIKNKDFLSLQAAKVVWPFHRPHDTDITPCAISLGVVGFIIYSTGSTLVLQECFRRVRASSSITYLTIRQLCLAAGTDRQARQNDHERAPTPSNRVVLLVLVPAHKCFLY